MHAIDCHRAMELGVDVGRADGITMLGSTDGDDELDLTTGGTIDLPEVVIEGEEQGPPGGGAWSHNHVPVHLQAWDLDAKPFATYRVQSGDTLAGLAVTYLGDGTRWKEIWDTGGNRSRLPDPDVINKPVTLDMPPEAADALRAWLAKGKPSNEKPGAIPKDERKSLNRRPMLIAAGAGVAALAAAYFVLR